MWESQWITSKVESVEGISRETPIKFDWVNKSVAWTKWESLLWSQTQREWQRTLERVA